MSSILVWINAKSKKDGASIAELRKHTQLEITRLGATKRTIKGYIDDLCSLGLVELGRNYKLKITPLGIGWLKRHGLYTE